VSATKSATKDFILAVQSSAGFITSTPGSALIARFCRAVRNGEQPAREDIEALAMALEPIALATTAKQRKDALAGFAKQSPFDADRGRKDRSAKVTRSGRHTDQNRYAHVLRYAIDRENGIDEMQARKLLMERANVGDRAARNMLNEHLKDAESEARQTLATRSSLEEKTRNI